MSQAGAPSYGRRVPRYLVEQSAEAALPGAAELLGAIVNGNDLAGVTWIHSYVSSDAHRLYCLYDAPSPESARRAARLDGLAIDAITEVSLLDPHPFT